MKKIQILGTGCPKCRKLADNVADAARELGVDYELVKGDKGYQARNVTREQTASVPTEEG